MLKPGDPAPDFAYRDLNGNPLRLADLRGKKAAVVYFYPKDFTAGCTREACSFRDRYPTLAEHDVEVIGISPQDDDTHEAFRKRHKLPFPLVPDTDRAIAKAYGALAPLGRIKRATFAIDKNGVIREVIRAEVFIDKHVNGIDAILEELSR